MTIDDINESNYENVIVYIYKNFEEKRVKCKIKKGKLFESETYVLCYNKWIDSYTMVEKFASPLEWLTLDELKEFMKENGAKVCLIK